MSVHRQLLRVAAMAAAAVGIAAAGAGCFSPKFDSCAVLCGLNDECPDGQMCLVDGRCHRSADEEMCDEEDDDGMSAVDGSGGGDGDDDGGGSPDAGDAGGDPDAGADAGPGVLPVTPGDLIISEVQKNPTVAEDILGEWFEIYNPTESTFDIFDLIVTDLNTPPDAFRCPAVIIPPGGTVLFGRTNDPLTNGGIDPQVVWQVEGIVFDLANGEDGDEIILVQPEGNVELDRIEYTDAFPNVPGVSMSLDPELHNADDNDLATSWCNGQDRYGNPKTGDVGSPGAANPDCL